MSQATQAARALSAANTVLVITGAGISVESGLPHPVPMPQAHLHLRMPASEALLAGLRAHLRNFQRAAASRAHYCEGCQAR